MTISKRFNFSELSFNRILQGINTRAKDIPHFLAWRFSKLGDWNRAQIKRFENIHKGERCFIVANGPSLSRTNLDYLENEFTFGLNRIYLNFDKSKFRPTYFVAANELVLDQFAQDIVKLKMPKFINWNSRSNFLTRDQGIIYLKPKHVLRDSFERDLTHPIVFGGTVTFVTLQLAFYMGFQQVIIVGMDHHFTEKGVPNEKEVRSEELDSSHFHPNYFPKGTKWQLPDLLRSEVDYSIARKAFEADRREILDATLGGKCEIFKKVDYIKVFEE